MIYALIKLYARFAIRIYCPEIIVNKPAMLKMDGPLLLACNHPNSFLDGMILTTLMNRPVYSLARGDAFKNRNFDRLLRWLKLLPVYRTSEGVENLEQNYTTFGICRQTFQKNGIVLIFSEGRCENEWHLRPLKKGTARLARSSWLEGIPLTVLPVGLNYSSFHQFGKRVHINFGDPLHQDIPLSQATEGKALLAINEQLEDQLGDSVYEIAIDDRKTWKQFFHTKKYRGAMLLLPFAVAGWLVHLPLFGLAKAVSHRFIGSGHYDSVLNALLLLAYPLYVVAVCLFAVHHLSYPGWLGILILPFLAWCYVTMKYALWLD